MPTALRQLANQNYAICIRNEEEYCGIRYQQCDATTNDFSLSGDVSQANGAPYDGEHTGYGNNNDQCTTDFIDIPCGSTAMGVRPTCKSSRFCGGALTATDEQNDLDKPASVYSKFRKVDPKKMCVFNLKVSLYIKTSLVNRKNILLYRGF